MVGTTRPSSKIEGFLHGAEHRPGKTGSRTIDTSKTVRVGRNHPADAKSFQKRNKNQSPTSQETPVGAPITPIEQVVRFWRDQLELFGVKPSLKWEILEKRTVKHLNHLALLDGWRTHWTKLVKWKVAAFAAWMFVGADQLVVPAIPCESFASEHPGALFGGEVFRYLRSLRRRALLALSHGDDSLRKRCLSIGQTVLQGKSAYPKPDELLVIKEVYSTFKDITTAPPPLPKEVTVLKFHEDLGQLPEDTSVWLTETVAKDEIRRTVREVFADARPYEDSAVWSFQVPSTSSTFGSRIVDGGAFLEVLGRYRNGELMDLVQLPGLNNEIGTTSIKAVGVETENHVERFPKRTLLVDSSELDARRKLYRLWLRSEALRQRNDVTIVGLAEALKVRPITKGNAIGQTALQSLQKWLHSTLKNHPVFRLIGHPLDAEYVNSRLGTSDLAPDEQIISGDYKGATNGMRSDFSAVVVDELFKLGLIDEDTAALFEGNLIHNWIQDPTTVDTMVEQQSAQLMGSITSFPVLCLINAALVRYCIEIMYKRKMPLSKAPMMINGDDNLWKGRWTCDKSPLTFFEDVARFFSFELSVGKTYASRDTAVINSRVFYKELTPCTRLRGKHLVRVVNYAEVPFFQWGLFGTDHSRSGPAAPYPGRGGGCPVEKADWYASVIHLWKADTAEGRLFRQYANAGLGLHIDGEFEPSPTTRTTWEVPRSTWRKDGKTKRTSEFDSEDLTDLSFGDYITECLELAPRRERISYYERILMHKMTLLRKCPIPWFAPQSLGGLGFPNLSPDGNLNIEGNQIAETASGLKLGMTDLDRQVAQKILFARLTGDDKMSPRLVKPEIFWTIHRNLMSSVPRQFKTTLPKDDPLVEELQGMYGKLVFDYSLRAPMDLLFDADSDKGKYVVDDKTLSHNAMLWRPGTYKALIGQSTAPTIETILKESSDVEVLMIREQRDPRRSGFTTPQQSQFVPEPERDNVVFYDTIASRRPPRRRLRVDELPEEDYVTLVPIPNTFATVPGDVGWAVFQQP